MELRSPDPAANPYLALALCLRAGMDGIKNEIMPPASIDRDLYTMSRAERKQEGLESIPTSLPDALLELEKDKLLVDTLGEHITKNYIRAKKAEWKEYSAQVTQWELDRYLLNF